MTHRVLRHAATDITGPLTRNSGHAVAHDHAMTVYGSNAIYSMIPSNACTTLRLSLALANGAIAHPREWRWIHKNNETFKPSLRELFEASYTFAVLRCPYARLVSCFLDKIASRSREAWNFNDVAGLEVPLARITFRAFCSGMAHGAVRDANDHWRPQTALLVYRDYDDLFCVEDLEAAAATLRRKIDFTVVDARGLARHDSAQHRLTRERRPWADVEAWELEAMMLRGERPDPREFYDDGLADITEAAYAGDFSLYRDHFRGFGLFDAKPVFAAVG